MRVVQPMRTARTAKARGNMNTVRRVGNKNRVQGTLPIIYRFFWNLQMKNFIIDIFTEFQNELYEYRNMEILKTFPCI